MSDLDEKLEEIYNDIGESFYWEGTLGEDDCEEQRADFVKEVTQAIADAGYVRVVNLDVYEAEKKAAYEKATGHQLVWTGAHNIAILPTGSSPLEQIRTIDVPQGQLRDSVFMTGQEWYNRYVAEKGYGSLDNLKDMPHSKDYSVGIDHAVIKCDEAARRAAGLK